MSDIRKGVREDGTVEGHLIETHWLPLEYGGIDGEGGFLSVVGDGGPINYEIRIPLDSVRKVLHEHDAAAELPEGDDDGE